MSIAAIVLAAGTSSRMGSNKLLAPLAGRPLIRLAVDAVLASSARPVIVVTGNDAAAIRAALAGCEVAFVHNPHFADGIATSIAAGIAAVRDADGADGALVCLGDMPRVRAEDLDALIAAFQDCDIVVPIRNERRGNPVLLGRAVFADVAALTGDRGARSVVERHAARTRTVAIDHDGIFVDVDTPDALTQVADT